MVRITPKSLRFTSDEFWRMTEAGLLPEKRVELIDGRVVRMSPQNDPHEFAIARILRLIAPFVSDDEMFTSQTTLVLDDLNTYDPDFKWYAVPIGTPREERPAPFLVIEVSDTTYRRDSGPKLRNYAEAGVIDYWILNLRANRLEVYRNPQGDTYDPPILLSRGELVSPLGRPDVTLPIAKMLP